MPRVTQQRWDWNPGSQGPEPELSIASLCTLIINVCRMTGFEPYGVDGSTGQGSEGKARRSEGTGLKAMTVDTWKNRTHSLWQ